MKTLPLALALALVGATSSYAQVVQLPPGTGGGSGSGGALVVTTTGPLSLTGPTVETNITSLKIPAGSVGANGMIRVECLWTYTNSSNNKSLIVRLNNTAGAVAGGGTPVLQVTTSVSAQVLMIIRNNNSVSSQTLFPAAGSAPYGVNGNALVNTANANTAADTWVNLSGTLAVGTETITLQHCAAIISYAP